MRRLPIAIIMALVLSPVVAAALVGCEASTQTSASDMSKAEANESETSKEEAKVQSAMSAAPSSIAKDAKIVDYPKEAVADLYALRAQQAEHEIGVGLAGGQLDLRHRVERTLRRDARHAGDLVHPPGGELGALA